MTIAGREEECNGAVFNAPLWRNNFDGKIRQGAKCSSDAIFDLAQLNTEAVQFDLSVLAANEVDPTIGLVANKITCLVDAARVRSMLLVGELFQESGILNESRGCLDWIIEIPVGDNRSFYSQFPCEANWDKTVMIIGINKPAGTGQRSTNRSL